MAHEEETYTCEMCHRILVKGWTDEEAHEEMRDLFGDISPEHHSIICDDCYKFVTEGHNDLIEHFNRYHNPYFSGPRFGCLKIDCWWRLHPD